MQITLIKANNKKRRLRVAAYVRTSTLFEDQTKSYEIQTAYFENMIEEKPEWENAGIYAERISGMKTEKRILIKSYENIGKFGTCLRVTIGEEVFMRQFMDALIEIDR